MQTDELGLKPVVRSTRHVKIFGSEVNGTCLLQGLCPELVKVLGHWGERLYLLRFIAHFNEVAILLAVNHELILTGQETWFLQRAHRDDSLTMTEIDGLKLVRQEHFRTNLVVECYIVERLTTDTCRNTQLGLLTYTVVAVGMVRHGDGLDKRLTGIAKLLLEDGTRRCRTVQYGQQSLTPVLSQLLRALLIGMQVVATATSILLLKNVGTPMLLEVVESISIAHMDMAGLTACDNLVEAAIVLLDELLAFLRSHGTILGNIVGGVPDGLVKHHMGLGPEYQQRVDNGTEVINIVVRRGVRVMLPLHRIVGA